MKRKMYILLFILLGFLLSVLLHALIELGYISLLRTNFARWSFGWSLEVWVAIHQIYTFILLLVGLAWGYDRGHTWWKRLYDNNGDLRREFQRSWRV